MTATRERASKAYSMNVGALQKATCVMAPPNDSTRSRASGVWRIQRTVAAARIEEAITRALTLSMRTA
jgi:hypothetical protein